MANAIAPPAAVAGPIGSPTAGDVVASSVVAIPKVALVRTGPLGPAAKPVRRTDGAGRMAVGGRPGGLAASPVRTRSVRPGSGPPRPALASFDGNRGVSRLPFIAGGVTDVKDVDRGFPDGEEDSMTMRSLTAPPA
jgi:hypothetical protein